MMEIVSVKFNPEVLAEIDKAIAKNNYNSRTEFIREAVRNQLAGLTREQLIEKFLSMRGKAPRKTTDEENAKTREEVFKQIAIERGWKVR